METRMEKSFPIAGLAVALLLALPFPSWGTIIDASYFWSSGTCNPASDPVACFGLSTGPVSGDILKVEERFTSEDQLGAFQNPLNPSFILPTGADLVQVAGAGPGNLYQYTVSNIGPSATLESFAVQVLGSGGITFVTAPAGWDVSLASNTAGTLVSWAFDALESPTVRPINGGDIDFFRIFSLAPRGLSSGTADDNGAIVASGPVSAPVPEPGTLLLLGSGLAGLGLLGRKRKEKAAVQGVLG